MSTQQVQGTEHARLFPFVGRDNRKFSVQYNEADRYCIVAIFSICDHPRRRNFNTRVTVAGASTVLHKRATGPPSFVTESAIKDPVVHL